MPLFRDRDPLEPVDLMHPDRTEWSMDRDTVTPHALKRRLAWAHFVVVPMAIGSFLLQYFAGFTYLLSLIAMTPVGVLCWWGPVRWRQRYVDEKYGRKPPVRGQRRERRIG